MSLLSLLLGEKKKTANVAKERLQFILTHERTGRNAQPDYLPALQKAASRIEAQLAGTPPASAAS